MMYKWLRLAFVATAVLAIPSVASAHGAYGLGISVSLHGGPMPCGPGGGGPQAGPWYLYWPMEAHFQTPAPAPYPYWPAAMTIEGGYAAPAAVPQHVSTPVAQPVQPVYYQPVGHYGQVPYYWYGR